MTAMLTAPIRALGGVLHKRATLKDSGWWENVMSTWGIGPSKAGISVTPQTSISASAVFACAHAIAEDIGTLPLKTYRRLKTGGKEEARGHPLWPVLHDDPNDEMTSMDFRSAVTFQALIFGNGYAEIQLLGNGRVGSLWPLDASRIVVERDDNDGLQYRQRNATGEDKIIPAARVLHIRGISQNGVMGMMITALGKEGIGLLLAAERLGASFFGNSARQGGVLEATTQLSPEKREELRTQWESQYSGSENAGKTAILPVGMTFRATTIQPDEAQFLETRQFQVEEVARWFRVPPHKIQHLLRATFANIEHQGIEYVTDTIRPWAKRWEQESNRKLLGGRQTEFFVEHVLEDLLRGDSAARSTFFREAINTGWMTRNEVRRLENMNERPDLDEPLVQGAMMAASALETKPKSEIEAEKVKNAPPPPPPLAPTPPPEPDDDGNGDDDAARAVAVRGILEAYQRPLADVIRSKLKVEASRVAKLHDKPEHLDKFYMQQFVHVHDAIEPVIRSAAAALWALDSTEPFLERADVDVSFFIDDAVERHIAKSRGGDWADDRPESQATEQLETLAIWVATAKTYVSHAATIVLEPTNADPEPE